MVPARLVDPLQKTLEVYRLENTHWVVGRLQPTTTIPPRRCGASGIGGT